MARDRASVRRQPVNLQERRERAAERFRAKGYPTVRDEEWRYTNPAPLTGDWARASTEAPRVPEDALCDGFESSLLVFVNGRFDAERSSVGAADGVRISGLAEAVDAGRADELGTLSHPGHAFASLNLANGEDGAVIEVAPRAVLARPIHIAMLASGDEERSASHPRVFVSLGAGSRAAIVESYGGAARKLYWTNAVTEIVIGEGAAIDYTKVQNESTRAYHTASITVRQGRDSRFAGRIIHAGAALSRDDIAISLEGTGAECDLAGMFAPAGDQHHDTHSRIDHVAAHCTSAEYYKGVVADQARGVFHGRIVVGAGAQKTDARQSNKNLLLSRGALVNSTPQLEILADDVKCKHGSTTGQIDPAALFYLRSRGIGEEAAKRLLVQAFAAEIVGLVRPDVRRAVASVLASRTGALVEEVVA